VLIFALDLTTTPAIAQGARSSTTDPRSQVCDVPVQPPDVSIDERVSVEIDDIDVAPGQQVRLRPYLRKGPWPWGDLPPDCFEGWALSSPTGTVTAGGWLRISTKVADGDVATISARLGQRSITAKVHIIDPKLHPLVGQWMQIAVPCKQRKQPAELIEEVIFGRDNHFSVTWKPFETYEDYWGRYTYDSRSHAVSMTIEGGNNIPSDTRLEGSVRRVAGDMLELRGVSFGTNLGAQAPRNCPLRFRKRGI
jgi:hypothetical protein